MSFTTPSHDPELLHDPAPQSDEDLHSWGWGSAPLFSSAVPPGCRPARVVFQSRDVWRVRDGVQNADLVAHLSGRARHEQLDSPVTGDWVFVKGDDDVRIAAVAPRRTTLSRKTAGARSSAQVLAANVDVVAMCQALDSINVRRLERGLTVAWESGATPLVIVTKVDRHEAPDTVLAEVALAAPGVDVLAVSAYNGSGIAALSCRITSGSTWALFGPSGVGKSTLVNALAGADVMATQEVRSDDKGRHTTTSRHLIKLASGGLILDSPGMREVGVWGEDSELDATFADVAQWAGLCRFSDCGHDREPGCLVQAAIDSGQLNQSRFAAWRQLQRELAYLARRRDSRLSAAERQVWKARAKDAANRTRP